MIPICQRWNADCVSSLGRSWIVKLRYVSNLWRRWKLADRRNIVSGSAWTWRHFSIAGLQWHRDSARQNIQDGLHNSWHILCCQRPATRQIFGRLVGWLTPSLLFDWWTHWAYTGGSIHCSVMQTLCLWGGRYCWWCRIFTLAGNSFWWMACTFARHHEDKNCCWRPR